MSNIRNEITYDVNKKRLIMEKIFLTIINSPRILEVDELSKMRNEKYITHEEFIATYTLALEVKKTMMVGAKRKEKLYQFLWNEEGLLNSNNLLKFVNYEVADMAEMKINNPEIKWRLSINKILKKIDENSNKTKHYKIEEQK